MRRGFAVGTLLIVIAVLAVILVATVGSRTHARPPAQPTQARTSPAAATLQAVDFSASIMRGWKLLSATRGSGRMSYRLSSTGAPVETFSVPPAGTIVVSILDLPIRTTSSSPTPLRTLTNRVSALRGARGVQLAAAPRAVLVAGAPAAEKAFTYTLHGRANIQVDVLVRHGGRTILVELNGQPTLGSESAAALQLLFSSWRWR